MQADRVHYRWCYGAEMLSGVSLIARRGLGNRAFGTSGVSYAYERRDHNGRPRKAALGVFNRRLRGSRYGRDFLQGFLNGTAIANMSENRLGNSSAFAGRKLALIRNKLFALSTESQRQVFSCGVTTVSLELAHELLP
jgi:hypothetical protein